MKQNLSLNASEKEPYECQDKHNYLSEKISRWK
jgi:hypothetical protein